jgi:hypothetical protein
MGGAVAPMNQNSSEGARARRGAGNEPKRNRHRGKGQQKVTVEHVHVHSGGQAIVGNVNGPGGGDTAKKEEQSHAPQIGYAPEPPMPGPDPTREPVPVASDAGCSAIDGSTEGCPASGPLIQI